MWLVFRTCWKQVWKLEKFVGMSWKNTSLHLALPWEIWGDILSHERSTYMYILMNQLAVIVWIIIRLIVSYMLEMSASSAYQDFRCWRNEMTHQERLNHAVHWTCGCSQQLAWRQCLHACIHAGGRHFEHMMKSCSELLHVWRFLRQWQPVVFEAIQWFVKLYM